VSKSAKVVLEAGIEIDGGIEAVIVLGEPPCRTAEGASSVALPIRHADAMPALTWLKPSHPRTAVSGPIEKLSLMR